LPLQRHETLLVSKSRESKICKAHLFVFGVLGAQNVHSAFSSDYATSVTHDLDGGPDFHSSCKRRMGIGMWVWVNAARRELYCRLAHTCEERAS
jgi:hypothetical protein